jgi:hypothetical protein
MASAMLYASFSPHMTVAVVRLEPSTFQWQGKGSTIVLLPLASAFLIKSNKFIQNK